jgi:GAF domain-containing protein/two-component sensor histidine kinase
MVAPPDDTTADPYAMIAILRAERDAALAREAALAEVLEIINRSPGKIEPVFDAIISKAMHLCQAEFGGLATYDGKAFHLFQAGLGPMPSPITPDAGSGLAQLVAGDPYVHIADAADTDAYRNRLEPRVRLVEEFGARTTLFVALRKDDALLGALTIYRRDVRPFTDTQIALVQGFAAQAAIAMENVRLLTEQREALEQQIATAEVLGVINASPGNLGPVFEAMLDRAMRLCDGGQGTLWMFDGERVRAAATAGYSSELAAQLSEWCEIHPFQRRLAQGERVFQIIDLALDDLYRSGNSLTRAAVDVGGIRTVVFVALVKDATVLGGLTIGRHEVRAFTDKQIALLENFAAQAVIAIENTRLITDQREALEQQTATAEVLQIINSSPGELGPVFAAMLERATTLCQASFGILWEFDGGLARAGALYQVPTAYAELCKVAFRPSPGSGPARVMRGEGTIAIADLTEYASYQAGDALTQAIVDLAGARSVVITPLRNEAATLGAITLYRQEVHPFTDKQLTLLSSFAGQAVIAMENARLLAETRESLEQQTATAELLGVINSSPGNLTPVFDAMLERAMYLCGAAYGVLRNFDGKRLRMLASRGVPAEYAEYLARNMQAQAPDTDLIPGTSPTQALQTGQPVQIADVNEGIPYRRGIRGARAIADLGGARTILHVPLVKDQVSVGLLTFYRQEVRPFTDKQIALLQNFAAQAVIAMDNARLITEQREALERQTATAEILQVINSSPGNLAPVFDALLEKAMRLCGAAFGSLYTYDGERFHSAAQRGVPPTYAAYRAKHPPLLTPGGAPAVLLETRRPVHVLDVATHEAYLPHSPNIRAMVELGGVRTSLAAPFIKDDVFLGFITIYRQEVRAFSRSQIALLESFAAQAVIAIENARLINEIREALDQQTATAEVLQIINASPGELTPVFGSMLEKAMRLCGAAFGSFYTYDGMSLSSVAQRGVPPAYAEYRARHPTPIRPGSGIAQAIAARRPLNVLDLQATEAYAAGEPAVRAMVELGGVRTLVAVPLCKDETVVGLITIYRQEVQGFSAKQIALLENFAAQAVIAMENARLLDEIRQRQAELRTTFDNMGDGVAMFDSELRLVAWNRNFQQIIDLPDSVLESRPRYTDYLRLLAEGGEFGTTGVEEEVSYRLANTDKELRLERQRPDGRVIEVRRNAVPGGGFVLIYSDITERKRSEEEIRAARDAAETTLRDLRAAQASLIQAEKMASLGQLTAGIAHEIKNPLNFVNNFASLSVDLLDELKQTASPGFATLDPVRRAEIDELTDMLTGNLQKISEHGRRADGIVRSMLEHSRGSSGERRSIDLNVLIDEALSLAYHGARAQDQSFNITLHRDLGKDMGPITLVPQDVTRVLLNLFSNGFYAARQRQRTEAKADFEPALTVTTRDLGDAAEIRVRDNGIGIPAEVRDRLFQPFFSTKPTGEGTGLGLSISYDIVTQQHGGSIQVESEPGSFTEFTVRLPRQQQVA